MLRAEFSLPSITAEEAAPERKAPIRVKFEIPYFTVSGIQVCLSTSLSPWPSHPFSVCLLGAFCFGINVT